MQNCSSLQKLSLAWLEVDANEFQYICQSGQTLQVLDLEECFFDVHNLTESLKALFTNCPHLTELSLSDSDLLDPHNLESPVHMKQHLSWIMHNEK